MKNIRVMAGLLAFAAALALASQSQASVEVNDHLQFTQGTGGGGGGIFKANNLTQNILFDTFCVEIHETINLGASHTYAVASIGTVTVQTNVNLTSYVAWLYNSFLNDTLSGGFNSGNGANVRALQLAIWLGMGYTDAQINSAVSNFYNSNITNLNAFSAGWQAAFNADVLSGDWIGFGDVRIMNLVSATNANAHYQDQLVRIPPPPGQIVPEAGSLAIWALLGAAAAIGCSRRKKSAA